MNEMDRRHVKTQLVSRLSLETRGYLHHLAAQGQSVLLQAVFYLPIAQLYISQRWF